MRIDSLRAMMLCVLAAFCQGAFAHGLVQDPPARNWLCGAVTKPDHVQNGVAQYPVCGGVFRAGRRARRRLQLHECAHAHHGPRRRRSANQRLRFQFRNLERRGHGLGPAHRLAHGADDRRAPHSWNISWGPHFSDSSDFRYWITKPGFVWQTGRALSFSDFEDLPFCDLAYNDATPNANPN